MIVQALPGIDTTKIRAVCIGEQTANGGKKIWNADTDFRRSICGEHGLKDSGAGRRLERRAYSGKIHRKTACYRDSFLVCSGNGYIFLTRVIPGSPFQGANVSESVLQMMEEEYGLHQPAGVQYVTYMKHLLRGNLGYSYQNPSESVAISFKDPGR